MILNHHSTTTFTFIVYLYCSVTTRYRGSTTIVFTKYLIVLFSMERHLSAQLDIDWFNVLAIDFLIEWRTSGWIPCFSYTGGKLWIPAHLDILLNRIIC